MRYVVAVSGGVDSVVLLDLLVRGDFGQHDLIVAHFDHGIRVESADDAEFVRSLAEKYGLAFETKREELGADASEELARERRYTFLCDVAKRHGAKIMTAHHSDDVIETIAINLTRGTGWRGLAVFDNPDIERPLLDKTKAELLAYAKQHRLEWREDVTNTDTKYLRNALRQKLADFDSESKQLLRLYRNRQVALKQLIDAGVQAYVHAPYSRHFFTMAPVSAAIEILRGIIKTETGQVPTRPQAERALLAIKTYRVGKTFALGIGHELRFSQTNFVVSEKAKVVS